MHIAHAQPHAREQYHAQSTQAPQTHPAAQVGGPRCCNSATQIDKIVCELDGIMDNARDLTAQFREMQKKYHGPGQISLSSLAALKERLGTKSGAPSTS